MVPKLSIVVVNYASSHKIERLLLSLEKHQPTTPYEIIIVDNFSSVTEQQQLIALKEQFTSCKNKKKNPPRLQGGLNIIQLCQNFGYGYANNEGFTFAQGEYIAIVNPDIELAAEIFSDLIQGLNTQPQAGICVPVLQTYDGKILDNARHFPTPAEIIGRRLRPQKNAKIFSNPTVIDWAQGSFWVMKKDTYNQLKGFDDRFFLFFEDTDFCRRVQTELSQKVYIIPHLLAIHAPNRLSGGNILVALFRKTFWIHIVSAFKYFWKWRHASRAKKNNNRVVH